jgi:guanylate kinase
MKEEKFLVIIGPSGAGKTSVVKALAARGILQPVPSWTTRPPRPEEQNEQVDHIFISEEEFSRRSREGFFLEEVSMFGLPYKYGLPRVDFESVSAIPVLLLRAPLVPLLQKHYSNYLIYQLEDSYTRISERLHERSEQGELQGERLAMYEKEIAMGRKVADRVIENRSNLDELTAKVEAYVLQDF